MLAATTGFTTLATALGTGTGGGRAVGAAAGIIGERRGGVPVVGLSDGLRVGAGVVPAVPTTGGFAGAGVAVSPSASNDGVTDGGFFLCETGCFTTNPSRAA